MATFVMYLLFLAIVLVAVALVAQVKGDSIIGVILDLIIWLQQKAAVLKFWNRRAEYIPSNDEEDQDTEPVVDISTNMKVGYNEAKGAKMFWEASSV